jgi:hypothetical protein
VQLVPRDGYLVQEEYRLVISPVHIAAVLKRARTDQLSVLLVHTHPFAEQALFSKVDHACEHELVPVVFRRVPQGPHGFVLLAGNAVDAHLFRTAERSESVQSVREMGDGETARSANDSLWSATLDRNVRAFGIDGQRRVAALNVAVVGAGGTGSVVAQQLAYLGVRRFVLLDPDHVERTNLNRLVGATLADVGRSKVDVVAENIRRIIPEASVVALQGSVLARRDAIALLDTDFIFGCTDTHGSRAVLNQIAYQYYIPTIDLGVRIAAANGRIESISGRVQLLQPGIACVVCQGLLDAELVRRDLLSDDERRRDTYILNDAEPQPAVISINSTVASLAVTMFLSVVAGVPVRARHQIYRGEEGVVRRVVSDPDPECIVCSARGALARGDAWPLPWRLS